jgi:hypothetical protein
MRRSSVVGLSLAFATAASASPFDLPPDFSRFDPISEGISWEPCYEDAQTECGRFEVPLDYQDTKAGKASLAVVRYAAINQPKLGTLFLNPGGPGTYYQPLVSTILRRHQVKAV